MMQMSLRLVPKEGYQDLAWLARTTSDLTEIYNFLLRAQIETVIDEEAPRPLTGADREAAVDGLVAQEGTPLVRASEGSMLLQLSQFLDATIGVQALAAFGLLLKKGPQIAAFPNKLREAWYSSAVEAIRARDAYERIKEETAVDVPEPPPNPVDVIQEPASQEARNEVMTERLRQPSRRQSPRQPPPDR
jgi:hypothetical protein